MSPSPACSRETRRAFGFSGSILSDESDSVESTFSTFRAIIFGLDTVSSGHSDIDSVGFLRITFGLILRTFLSQVVFSGA